MSYEEIKAITKAAKAGIPVHRHTFHDGPDQYERIVFVTAKTKKNIFGSPVFTWKDVISLETLQEMTAK